MSYLVLARKYRPQRFDEVVGQDHVGLTLQNAMAGGRLAHAYLFCGPRGVGKTTMARILAKAVNCLESPGPTPCGKCDACNGIAAGTDVDVIELDAASNRGVADVEPLIDASRYLPQRSARKIFIVDEAHMLSKHAWNSLLKTLEEPPAHVLFIFATTEPHKVIETVRSRCQRFDFKRITASDIARKLHRIASEEKARVEGPVFDEIAARATGGMRDAETLLDQALAAAPGHRPLSIDDLVTILGGIPRDLRHELITQAHAGDAAEVLDAAGRICEAGADPVELLQDLYGDLHEWAVRHARGADDEGPGVEWCLAAAEIVARHQRLARDSRAARATLDLALLALARLGDVCNLEELASRLERLAAGGAPATAPAGPPAAPRVDPPRPAPSRPVARRGTGPALRPRDAQADTPPQRELEPSAPNPENVAEPQPPPDPPGQRGRGRETSVSSEELTRIRGLPRVREVLETFGGRIEQVRRDEDG